MGGEGILTGGVKMDGRETYWLLAAILFVLWTWVVIFIKARALGIKSVEKKYYFGNRPMLLISEQEDAVRRARNFFDTELDTERNYEIAKDILLEAHNDILYKNKNQNEQMESIINSFKFLYYAELVNHEATRRYYATHSRARKVKS